MAQRGIRQSDLDLILQLGSEVEGGLIVREKDFRQFERKLRREIEHASRLVGKRLVLGGDHLVTAYHASRADTKRLLRS
jgi:arginase family enzyme